jgi:hypothetical protein
VDWSKRCPAAPISTYDAHWSGVHPLGWTVEPWVITRLFADPSKTSHFGVLADLIRAKADTAIFDVRFRGIIKRIGTTVIMSACSHEPPSSQQLRYIIEPGDGLVQTSSRLLHVQTVSHAGCAGGVVPGRDNTFLVFNLGRCAALYIAPSRAPVIFLSDSQREARS